jgi:GH18 family chitinase
MVIFINRLLSSFLISLICSFSIYSQSNFSGPDIFVADNSFKVVGYLSGGNFDQIDLIELDKITHLCLAFANPDADGNLLFRNGADVSPVVKKAHEEGVKVLVSLAGGGKPDAKIWTQMLERENRTAFIKQITDFVQKEDLDGVDVDIEWNLLPAIDTLYAPFVIALKQALHASGKMITCALNVSGLHPAVTRESLLAYDFINVMVYDKTGPWKPEVPGQHAPYSYAEEAHRYWTQERMIPAEKLTLGVPFYGHNFDPVGSEHFSNIVANDVGNAYKDEVGALYYNGIPEIVRKTELAKKKFNGVMIWELAQDAHNDLSLLRAIDQTIKAGACKVSIYFRDEDNDGHGNLAKPFHACEKPEGYVSSNDDPNDSDPNIHP